MGSLYPYKRTATVPDIRSTLASRRQQSVRGAGWFLFALPFQCEGGAVWIDLRSICVKKLIAPMACVAMVWGGGSVFAQERAMIVFDGSGSMWGQIDGRLKHEIARQALMDMLATVPEDMELGLMAYGHREKGSCSDIETLVVPGPQNKVAIQQAIASMRFLGKTPLTEAVRQAAEQLRHTEEKATVILITDGEETCQADPCALGHELERTGVDFTAHVVGFGLTAEQGQQVACLAHHTGGQYFEATNAARLQQALLAAVQPVQTVVTEPVAPTIVAPTPSVLPQASVDAPEVAGAGTLVDISWTGPNDSNDFITIVQAGAADSRHDTYQRSSRGSPLTLQAPDQLGAHEIRYISAQSGQVLARQGIELIPVQATVSGPEQAVAGARIQVSWTGPDSPGDYLTVVEKGASDSEYQDYVRSSKGNPASLHVPDGLGNYEIRYVLAQSKRVLATQAITLGPVSATLEILNTPVLGGNASIAWSGPENTDDYISVADKGAPEDQYKHYVRVARGSPVSLRLPTEPGEYEIRYVMSRSKRVLVSVPFGLGNAVSSITAPATVNVGSVIEVTWTGPGNDQDYIELIAAEAASGAKPVSAARVTQGSPLSLQAPGIAGRYLVRYRMRETAEVLASQEITVQ